MGAGALRLGGDADALFGLVGGAVKQTMAKAVMALGHCESERYGMEVLADWMAEQLTQDDSPVDVRYLDTEDTYVVL